MHDQAAWDVWAPGEIIEVLLEDIKDFDLFIKATQHYARPPEMVEGSRADKLRLAYFALRVLFSDFGDDVDLRNLGAPGEGEKLLNSIIDGLYSYIQQRDNFLDIRDIIANELH